MAKILAASLNCQGEAGGGTGPAARRSRRAAPASPAARSPRRPRSTSSRWTPRPTTRSTTSATCASASPTRRSAGALQGLHPRRGAHAHAGGVERVPQDARGAAAAHDLRAGHDRGQQGAADGRGPLPPVRLRPPERSSRSPRCCAASPTASRSRSPTRRSRSSPARPPARSATRSGRWSSCSPTRGAAIVLDDVLAVLGAADADLLFGTIDAISAGDARSRAARRRPAGRLGPRPRPLLRRPRGPRPRPDGHPGARRRSRPSCTSRPSRTSAWPSRPRRVGGAEVVRLLELIAVALRAMKDGADPRTQLELALVKAAKPDLEPSVKALQERIARLESNRPRRARAGADPGRRGDAAGRADDAAGRARGTAAGRAAAAPAGRAAARRARPGRAAGQPRRAAPPAAAPPAPRRPGRRAGPAAPRPAAAPATAPRRPPAAPPPAAPPHGAPRRGTPPSATPARHAGRRSRRARRVRRPRQPATPRRPRRARLDRGRTRRAHHRAGRRAAAVDGRRDAARRRARDAARGAAGRRRRRRGRRAASSRPRPIPTPAVTAIATVEPDARRARAEPGALARRVRRRRGPRSSRRCARGRRCSPPRSTTPRPPRSADDGLTLAWPESSAFLKRKAEDPANRDLIVKAIRVGHRDRRCGSPTSCAPTATRCRSRPRRRGAEAVRGGSGAAIHGRVRRGGASSGARGADLMPQPPNLQKMLAEAQAMLAAAAGGAGEAQGAEGRRQRRRRHGQGRDDRRPAAREPRDRPRRGRSRGRRDAAGHGRRRGQRGAAQGRGAPAEPARRRRAGRLRPDERARVARPRRHGRHGRPAAAAASRAARRRRARERQTAPRRRAQRRTQAHDPLARPAPPAARHRAVEAAGDRQPHRAAARVPRAAHLRPTTRCALAQAIIDVKEKITLCEICFNLAEGPRCTICLDERRDTERDLRRRGAQRRDPDRAHARVPRPLPRARRRALADRRRRARGPAARPALRARRSTASARSCWPRTRPRPARRPRCTSPANCTSARPTSPSPGSRPACRSAATWSTPTRSRSAAPSPAAARSSASPEGDARRVRDAPSGASLATARWRRRGALSVLLGLRHGGRGRAPSARLLRRSAARAERPVGAGGVAQRRDDPPAARPSARAAASSSARGDVGAYRASRGALLAHRALGARAAPCARARAPRRAPSSSPARASGRRSRRSGVIGCAPVDGDLVEPFRHQVGASAAAVAGGADERQHAARGRDRVDVEDRVAGAHAAVGARLAARRRVAFSALGRPPSASVDQRGGDQRRRSSAGTSATDTVVARPA